MQTKKIAILGFAHGHVGMYCARWKEQPELGIQAVAGWDHNADRASSACANLGLEAAASAEEILCRDDIEAIAIASETSMHADLVELAASYGKTIILQKPMALTMEQADRIVKAVDDAKVPFTMAWQMRVDPHNNKAKQLMTSGEFGRTYMVRRRHCLPTQLMADFDKTWHVNPALNRDIFADDASHAIDFIYWMLGMPVSVSAELGTLLNPVIPNDNGIAVYRYADGTFGEVSCTFTSVAGENVLEIICENGSIIGNYGDLTSCNIPWPDGGIQLKWYLQKEGKWIVSDLPDIRSHGERIAGLAGPLAEFIHGVRPPVASVKEGQDVLRMTLACYDSDSEGKRIYF